MSMEAGDEGTEANGTNKLTTKLIIPPRQRQERGVARDWDTNPREIQPRPPEFQRVRIGTRIAIHRPVRLYPYYYYDYYDYDDSCKLQPSPHEQPGSPVDRDKPRLDPEDAQSPPASIRCDRYICRRQMERLARDCPELKQPGVGVDGLLQPSLDHDLPVLESMKRKLARLSFPGESSSYPRSRGELMVNFEGRDGLVGILSLCLIGSSSKTIMLRQ
ncbi:hypothetical protein C8Q69DRAFT_443712 [Paecilomyces variotii]|uniref:Uncharacterized protein n=1 Tax=Byssochlamys spectabilis TaxID=264951 RepID=A0A443HVW7_BYSSP|nr:hypothetical protein C8Q69DRAFT_443712 [Paecilomyces variotii]RWQ95973.1 hypothetical protein C8Q69DRAFT_443712 [Paecilomyces variotii]